jgi:hypothetical protein
LGHGNPVQSEEIIVGKLAMEKLEQASGHLQKTRDALYPVEVKKLWEVLRANGFSTDDFMRYTMFLQAITLGNRTCGMLGTTIACFNDHLEYGSNSVEYGIQSVGWSVFEKGEVEKTVYSIKFEDDHPWFCFLRHFLIYVWCYCSEAGLHPDMVPDEYYTDEKGVIIVSTLDLSKEKAYPLPLSSKLHKEITESPVVFVHGESATDWHVKELVLEVRLDRDIRCKAGTQNNWTYCSMHDAGIISDDDNVNMGNHSTRKSTYLWGIIGDGELELVKEHVRHKTNKCEKLYRSNSCTIKRFISEDPELC